MKKTIRPNITLRTGFLNILFCMLGFLSACQFEFQPGIEYASLSLAYTPSTVSSRTIQPNDQDLACVKYVVHGLSDSGKTFDVESTETTTVLQNLSCEHWSVTVTGVNASNVAIATGSSAVTLSVGSTNTLRLTLLPLRQAGSISINLTVPADLNVVTVKGELCDGMGVVVDSSIWKRSATIWNYQNQMTSGTYLLRIQGYDSEGRLSFNLYEAVNVVANLTARWDYAVPLDAVNVSVTSIALDQTTLNITLGGAGVRINATLSPSNATDTWVFWSSSNASVVTVDDGVVTALSTGLATITATTADGAKSSSCAITVTAPVVSVSAVTLDSSSHSLVVGGATFALTPTISPSNASNKAVTWTTSDSRVATVDGGVVTPVSAGSATITVTTLDGAKTATCVVTVTAAVVSVTGVTLDSSSHSLVVGGATFALTPTISPSNASNKAVTWTSSNPSVATVNPDGLVQPMAAGQSTISVRTNDGGKVATCTILVGYGILYDSNTSDSGTVPLDDGVYAPGDFLAVRSNSGNLAKVGYAFVGWNTQSDGKGTAYLPDVQILMTRNLVLYATWGKQATVTITNPSAPDNFTGTIVGAEHLHYGEQTVYTSTYNGNAKTYQWYLNGVPLLGSTASALTFTPLLGSTPYGTNILTLVVRDANGGLYSGSLTITVGN